MKQNLSKSQFLRGIQCGKSLWLFKYRPELRTEPDESQQAVFDTGTEVGLMARQLFPNGKAIEYEGSTFDGKVRITKELIDSGAETIYEASFIYDDIFVMVDILHRGPNGWEIYEVKSSTDVKDVHISDLAVQYFALAGSGLPVSGASLVYINSQYVKEGEIDINALFKMQDLTDDVKNRQRTVKEEVSNLKEMLKASCPDTDIGTHCSNPYECDFMAHCWSHIPECSVFSISRLHEGKKFKLYYDGIIEFKDIPKEFPLNPNQLMQVQAELTGKEFIDPEGIREFLSTLYYPLYFLDFETFQQAVPIFDGTRPYEQIPFQYSLHCLEEEGAELGHSEFLAKEGTDPREALAKSLVNSIPSDACILAYNMGFEKGVIKRLAEQFPDLSEKLMSIHDNIKDLMTPFQKKMWYRKEMNGSYSIKKDLPALVPELSYNGMEVSNGGEAMAVYSTLHLVEDLEEREKKRKHLLEYCGLDTLAMVRVLERLRAIALQ